MALNLYTGDTGSGKSYSVVATVIIPALKKGRHVVTNIPLEVDLLTQVFGGTISQLPLDALDDPDLPDLFPPGCVAVVDECWNRWPSGQRLTKAPKGDQHWLKEHRHRVDDQGNSMQVVLCTQNPGDLAKWVRDLIAHTFWMTKLEELGMDDKCSVRIFKKCPTGEADKIPKRQLLRVTYLTYEPEIYQYYRSATQSKINDVGIETTMDRRTSMWRSPGFLFQTIGSPILCVVAVCVLIYFANRLSGNEPEKEEGAHVAAAVEPVHEPSPAPLPPAQLVNPMPPGMDLPAPQPAKNVEAVEGKRPSSTWRVAGYIRRADSAAGRNSAAWSSKLGYGDAGTGDRVKFSREDQVILTSMNGVRYLPLSACKAFEDGFNYSCDIDGERATPWSGRMGMTDINPAGAVSGSRNVTVERSETVTSAHPARTAQLPSQPAHASASVASAPTVTVVSDSEYSSRPWR
jgi:zona occludens toxin